MEPERGLFKRIGQGAVVVVSILLAFGLDAVWEESKERRDLREDLANISLELQENRARVEYHLDMAGRMVAALDVLVDGTGAGEAAVMVPDTTVWLAHVTPTLDASLGAIDALIASGRMAVMNSPELSRRLAGLRDRIGDAQEEQVQALDLHLTQVLPFLAAMDPLATRHIGDAFWAQERIPGRALEYRADISHPGGLDLRNLLETRRTLYYVTMGELRALLVEFDLIEELLRTEIGLS